MDVLRLGKISRPQAADNRLVGWRGHLSYSSRAALIFFTLVGLQLSSMHQPALAATEVRGQVGDIQLDANNATIKEVLEVLARSYKLTYKIPPSLHSDLTVHCSGTLRQILERALDGHDYILKVLDDHVEVVVLGASGTTSVAPSASAIAVSTNTNASAPGREPVVGPGMPEHKPAPPLSSYLSQGPGASVTP